MTFNFRILCCKQCMLVFWGKRENKKRMIMNLLFPKLIILSVLLGASGQGPIGAFHMNVDDVRLYYGN